MNKMDKVHQIYNKIDRINIDILDLLKHYATLINDIVVLKYGNRFSYYDLFEEEKILRDIISKNNGPFSNELIRELFSSMLKTMLQHIGIDKDKKLLISSSTNKFESIHEMFNLIGDCPIVFAGPCAIENVEYLERVAEVLIRNKLMFIRGGAYKPRTSPYEFQGLKEDGLKILYDVSKKNGLLSVTEVVDTRDVEMIAKYADIFQIGARNMQNYELLKEVGQTKHPVILKRGMSASIEELIFAAEYIALQGSRKIILCERGIRTFEKKTRNTLDIASIAILKKETGLPVIADLSHSLGRKDIINDIAKSVLACGADGIMVEVHPDPESALSDEKQQLNINEFENLLKDVNIA